MTEMNHDPKGESGAQKDPLHLLPPVALRAASRTLRLGATKYGKWNFRDNQVCASTYIGAMMRHIAEYNEGIDVDHESGEHPLAHVIASAMIVLDAIEHGTLVDDRWRKQ